MATPGFLGIDIGTQGLSAIFVDKNLNTLAVGQGSYEMVAGLAEGSFEQQPEDWKTALVQAMGDLRSKLLAAKKEMRILAIGISGQMHGEVLTDKTGRVVKPARLWCDSRNEAEGIELTERLGVKIPKRMTAARWLWTTRQLPDLTARVARITTPAGWISFLLTGQWTLGIGDASGMFPVDQKTLQFDVGRWRMFQQLVGEEVAFPLTAQLPELKLAGQDGGVLHAAGAELLGLEAGIPVAPAEGDQPAALAGSAIADAGLVAASFGTSVTANLVGDRAFVGVSNAIDHFCAVDGKPINMVLLRNGTTFMNTVAEMFLPGTENDSAGFADLMHKACLAAPDCGGLLAIPFMADEPGLGIGSGNVAGLHGINSGNATAENLIKAALLATMFNLKSGMDILSEQGFPRTEIVLTGGLTRTPGWGQVLADVTQTTVRVPSGSEEGTAVGSALLAKYRWSMLQGCTDSWSMFLRQHAKPDSLGFHPSVSHGRQYGEVYQRYRQLIKQFR